MKTLLLVSAVFAYFLFWAVLLSFIGGAIFWLWRLVAWAIPG